MKTPEEILSEEAKRYSTPITPEGMTLLVINVAEKYAEQQMQRQQQLIMKMYYALAAYGGTLETKEIQNALSKMLGSTDKADLVTTKLDDYVEEFIITEMDSLGMALESEPLRKGYAEFCAFMEMEITQEEIEETFTDTDNDDL